MEEFAISVVKQLKKAGYEAFFAGGWVRDFILGHASSDVDISTSASPDEVIALFPKTVPVGKAFGVVIVIEGGHPFEVASFRKDGLYIDGRHPSTIEKGTALEDAQRRDFTVNGLFYDPIEQEIIDFVGGQQDIKKGVIKAIGKAEERFQEDRLRMIRAVRFSARFDWPLAQETEDAIKTLSHSLFPSVAKERVWDEWVKMGERKGLGAALLLLHKVQLLIQIMPPLADLPLEEPAHKLNLFPLWIPLAIRFALTFESQPLHQMLKEMRVSNEVLDDYHHTMQAIPLLKSDPIDPVAFVNLFSHHRSKALLEGFIALYPEREQRLKSIFEKHEEAIKRKRERKFILSSQRLMQEGIKPGKTMGLLIQKGEEAAIRQSFTTEDTIIEYLKKDPIWKVS